MVFDALLGRGVDTPLPERKDRRFVEARLHSALILAVLGRQDALVVSHPDDSFLRGLGSAALAAKPATETTKLHFDVKKAKLGNGLRVVMLVDHTSPTVALDLVYDVGARNEERGKTGFAHLFEHMMFQGSQNVAKGEHMKLVSSHGGAVDATTGVDRTNYYEMLPSSELPLALWLEADRMKTLDVSLKNLDNQRAVVKEEYRMRIENAAYVPAMMRLEELVYQGYWPYEHAPIGSLKDLDAAQIEWVKRLPLRVLRAEQRHPRHRRRLR